MGLFDTAEELIDKIMSTLNQAPAPGPHLAIGLSQLAETMRQNSSGLEKLQSDYRNLVEAHLRSIVPFHWNKYRFQTADLPMDKDTNLSHDIEQYHQLVQYSLNARDNYSILNYWGFVFPFEESQFGLARDESEDYILIFEMTIESIHSDFSIVGDQKEKLIKHYNYLINKFRLFQFPINSGDTAQFSLEAG